MKALLKCALLLVISASGLSTAFAQQPQGISMKNTEAQAFLGTPIRLYPDNTDMQTGDREQWGHLSLSLPGGFTSNQYLIRNVTNPSLYAFLPEPGTSTGTAVIVAPGGAFLSLAVQTEGADIARALNKRGITAFVLTYTLNETPRDIPGYQKIVADVFGAKARGEEPDIFVPQAPQDALTALRYVKTHASKYNVDPAKIGFMGFSAGAMTSISASIADTDNRPAFLGYVYGPMYAIEVPANAPPLFAAIALDDGLFGRMGLELVGAWQKQNLPVELHAYEKGEHGFGAGRPGTTSMGMIDQFVAWLATHNM